MGEKDITEKILADYNDVFADIMNGLLFAGEQRILPEALENTSIHSQYKAEDEKVHELERDVAKYWKEKEVELAICGIENQSVVEKNMPFRVIGYDGTAYRSQLLEERKKILPVVTIVLYFGTDRHWNSEKNIKSLMEIPEGLDKFVNDYSMQVFEIAWLTEEEKKASRVEFILRVLEIKGTVDEKTRKRIEEEQDVDLLDNWLTNALKANTVQEFETRLPQSHWL